MKIKAETWVRTAVLILALLNTLLSAWGKNPLPFSEEESYQAISAAVTAAVSLWAWWKNNSFTPAALEADAVLQQLKETDR